MNRAGRQINALLLGIIGVLSLLMWVVELVLARALSDGERSVEVDWLLPILGWAFLVLGIICATCSLWHFLKSGKSE